jgi:transcription-repair coupling factor (superfamily II helicase)
MRSRLIDRFGTMPVELERLFIIVKIRQLGKKLGFEKIIIKNGVLIAFFITNPLSQYYRSDRFSKVLEKVNEHPKLFEVKQPDGKLRIIVRNVDGLEKAYKILKML